MKGVELLLILSYSSLLILKSNLILRSPSNDGEEICSMDNVIVMKSGLPTIYEPFFPHPFIAATFSPRSDYGVVSP